MAVMVYVVYDSSTGAVDSFRATLAEANTRAATSAVLTAYGSAVELPAQARPGTAVFDTTNNAILVEKEPVPPELDRTKALLLGVHRAYFGVIYPHIEFHAWAYPYALRSDVKDAVLGQIRAAYIRMNDASLTLARRRDYLTKVQLGPSDSSGTGDDAIRSLFASVDAADFSPLWTARGRGAPLEYLLWNSGSSAYDRRTFGAAVAAARTDFPVGDVPDWSTISILSESWTQAIPDYTAPD